MGLFSVGRERTLDQTQIQQMVESSIDRKIQPLQAKIALLEASCAQKDSDLATIRAEFDKLKVTNQELIAKNQELSETVAKLNTRVTELTAENTQLKAGQNKVGSSGTLVEVNASVGNGKVVANCSCVYSAVAYIWHTVTCGYYK